MGLKSFFINLFRNEQTTNEPIKKRPVGRPSQSTVSIPAGRVSVPDSNDDILSWLRTQGTFVEASFQREIIPLIRNLYKVNPDVSMALQDMFKLANTGHKVTFPNNTAEESKKMRDHLNKVTKTWTRYTFGINGIVNKFIVQSLVSGAISIEAVPKNTLDGIATIVFVNPEGIIFKRENNGVYHPYQVNKSWNNRKSSYIKLNTETYVYSSMYNDTDEPYGIPPFMASLDSLKTQSDMRINIKQIMEMMGLMGFLEALMEKPDQKSNESDGAYETRLNSTLKKLKTSLYEGVKDGIVVGYEGDHSFKMNSTTKDVGNIDKVYNMNQQSVANGLGVNSTLIGVSNSSTEGGTSVLLSKMISQLKNISMNTQYVLEFIYDLELRLAGFNNKGSKVEFYPSTVTDEMKLQQATEYKIRNNVTLYKQGIIDQDGFAFNMGYNKPSEKEPRVPLESVDGEMSQSKKKEEREKDKDTSDRKTRDKNKPVPKRKDGDTKPR